MLNFDLKKALMDHEARSGHRLTYEELAQLSGVSVDTVKSIANRNDYNTSLKMVSDISKILGVDPTGFFIWNTDD